MDWLRRTAEGTVAGERLITECRKSGDLPLDICAEDASRDAVGVELIDKLECKRGAPHGRPRIKLAGWDELLKAARG